MIFPFKPPLSSGIFQPCWHQKARNQSTSPTSLTAELGRIGALASGGVFGPGPRGLALALWPMGKTLHWWWKKREKHHRPMSFKGLPCFWDTQMKLYEFLAMPLLSVQSQFWHQITVQYPSLLLTVHLHVEYRDTLRVIKRGILENRPFINDFPSKRNLHSVRGFSSHVGWHRPSKPPQDDLSEDPWQR